MKRPPHQQRVINEQLSLNDKLQKLDKFITSSPLYFDLPPEEQEKLVRQLSCMTEYTDILSERISSFAPCDEGCAASTFGEAMEALKAGKRVTREGWNGSGMFIFRQVPSTIESSVIPKMTSLPETVKAALEARARPIHYSNQMALVKPDNSINGWAPSAADALAEDWLILD